MKKKTHLIMIFVILVVIFVVILNRCGSDNSNNNSNNVDNKATQIFTGKELFTSQELDGEVVGIDFGYNLSSLAGKDLTISKEHGEFL